MSSPIVDTAIDSPNLSELRGRFDAVRRRTSRLAEPLPVEDQVVQTMANVSPTKWHLAHTAWFFETFVAGEFIDDYQVFRDRFAYLFNSYYKGAGPCFERSRRGTIGRPTVETIGDYRSYVDDAVRRLFDSVDESPAWAPIVEVGLHHEQQHQELILTDIKHVLASNPLRPAYRDDCTGGLSDGSGSVPSVDWIDVAGGVHRIGYDGDRFCFDNERPRHRVFVDDFQLASRPVTCGEFIEFIEDGGYDTPRWWLSEGWQAVCEGDWQAPLYWERRGDWWSTMTLGGMRPVDMAEPVCHVSYFEADAFARWAGARLPTEAEWEVASTMADIDGNFLDSDRLHPQCVSESDGALRHLFGDVWEWTSSAYEAYPGFEPWDDTLGEYTGKFMCNQYVLRGGSCATSKEHIRRTYRNFFAPQSRWQFSGFRLAR